MPGGTGTSTGTGTGSPGDPAAVTLVGIGSGSVPGGTDAGITIPPPQAVEFTSPVSGFSFGKAPFLWPLFLALDVIAMAGVVFVLRKTWSKRPD